MIVLAIAIIMQTSQPKLELPKIIVYGKRNVRLEIFKEDLIPDTVSKLTLLKPIMYNRKLSKFSYPEKYIKRSSLLNGTLSVGGSPFLNPITFLKLFYGRDNFYTIASYSYNRKMVKHSIEVNTRLPYIRGDFVFKKYKDNDSLNIQKRDYTRVSLTSNINKGPSYFEGNLLLGNLTGEEQELAIFLKSSLLKKFKHYLLISNTYLSWNKVWLLYLSERLSKKWGSMGIEPGINICSSKPCLSPYFRFWLSNFFIEYSPKVVLRTRDESLTANPFIKNVLAKKDKEELKERQTYVSMGVNLNIMDIRGGWIQNYPSFCMDTIIDTTYNPDTAYSYSFDNTEIIWISSSIYWKGMKIGANFSYSHESNSYNYKLAPHIPLAYVSIEYNWGNFTVIPSYKYVKDYAGKPKHLLSFNLSWHSPYQFIYSISRPTFFVEGENLFNGYEIWRGYHEKPKLCVGTKFKL